ncbi:thiol-disulfide oxidoreductase DCC family protein [Pontiella sp.]|uniref:thiol-disulfide oxidoreductase DCC family protein n=1 Tax=Pontiella sp. TaxID=2837462 RepID=UPI003563E24B
MNDADKILILFDGECPLCRRKIRFFRRRDKAGRLAYADIRAEGFESPIPAIGFDTLERKIHAVTPEGEAVSGMAAIRAVYRAIGLGWLAAPTGWPGLRPAFDLLYRGVAKNRILLGRILRLDRP